jgi:heme-degrading monooxygenase HmoA
MFARLVRFTVEPGFESKAQDLANELGPLISVQPGCQAVTVFGDKGDGEYGIYVLWDTQENADTAAGVVRPQLNENLAGHVKAPPDTRLFEVLFSK